MSRTFAPKYQEASEATWTQLSKAEEAYIARRKAAQAKIAEQAAATKESR
jgi:hypothetical protein